MSQQIDRREFVRTGAAAGLAAAAAPRSLFGRAGGDERAGDAAHGPGDEPRRAPVVHTPQSVPPVVISDVSGSRYRNGGPRTAVEEAFRRLTGGEDVLGSLIAGVNIPENDPEEMGIGYGGLPNADGVVQLDSCCMHGPKKRAGAVAALDGVRTPSLVAKAVMNHTDHHLLVGEGAQEFARAMGFDIEDSLLTDGARERWLEWRRRIDPEHWLDPKRRAQHAREVGLQMVREGLIPAESFWGTINCDGIAPNGDMAGVTTTSGLAWKIPGRVGDSPILGAGLYVDDAVGACGSTGRGEANLYNLTPYLIVENMRRGMHPKDAGMEGLRRIRQNTVEERLLDERGEPNFNVRFFVLNKAGEFAGVSMYATGESVYAVCTENGLEERQLEPLLGERPGT